MFPSINTFSFKRPRDREMDSPSLLRKKSERVSLDDMPAKTRNHSDVYRVCIHKPKEVNP